MILESLLGAVVVLQVILVLQLWRLLSRPLMRTLFHVSVINKWMDQLSERTAETRYNTRQSNEALHRIHMCLTNIETSNQRTLERVDKILLEWLKPRPEED